MDSLRDVFKKHSIYAIVNCAALKAVGESVQKPVLYYKNNIGSVINLLSVKVFLTKFIHKYFFFFLYFISVWKNLM